MIKTLLRLEFEHIFPEEEEKNIIEYLKLISPYTLLNVIGFSNTFPQPNFDTFVSDPTMHNNIVERVVKYARDNNLGDKPIVVSREASLKLAEIILSNRKLLIEENKSNDRDSDEINLFKSFLIINKEVNSKQKLTNSEDNFEKLVDMSIVMMFSTGDIGMFENNDWEFGKLLYTTLVRFELLLRFLQSKEEYSYLEKDLYEYFGQNNSKDLTIQMKYLLGKLLELKAKNGFKFNVEDEKSLGFLNSLASSEIIEDEDFTILRNYPIYKIDNNTFSIIDFFFVLDKFSKSVKFILKNSFNNHHNLRENDRSFFEFYNTKFSEEFLMKNILDNIFNKPYFIKKKVQEVKEHEPDYYVRHNKRIYLFENKDVLIAKNIRSSGDINKINEVLRVKFFESNNKSIGIGQLVNSIIQIVNNNFKFDDYVNHSKNIIIYPILLINDRIFEIPGINYRLNQWYLQLVKEKLGDKYNPNFIKNLTIIDINTLIYWLPFLEKNDSNFRIIIDNHLKDMTKRKKTNHSDYEKGKIIANKNLTKQIAPISSRFHNYKFPMNLLIEKFKDVLTK